MEPTFKKSNLYPIKYDINIPSACPLSKFRNRPSKTCTEQPAWGKKRKDSPLPLLAHVKERNFAWTVYFQKMPLTSKKAFFI